jgi:hypothetical protein
VAYGPPVWFSKESLYKQGYTKDMALLVPGKFPNTVSEHMLRAMNIVQGWPRAKNPSATPNKTELVLFSKRRKAGFTEPTPLNTVLHTTRSVKYLWVILHAKLSWRQHVKQKISNANYSFFLH